MLIPWWMRSESTVVKLSWGWIKIRMMWIDPVLLSITGTRGESRFTFFLGWTKCFIRMVSVGVQRWTSLWNLKWIQPVCHANQTPGQKNSCYLVLFIFMIIHAMYLSESWHLAVGDTWGKASSMLDLPASVAPLGDEAISLTAGRAIVQKWNDVPYVTLALSIAPFILCSPLFYTLLILLQYD